MKPRIGFDLPDISFDLRPTKDCGVTHIKWHRGHVGTHRRLVHGKCPEHKLVGLEVECYKQSQMVSFWWRNELMCYSLT